MIIMIDICAQQCFLSLSECHVVMTEELSSTGRLQKTCSTWMQLTPSVFRTCETERNGFECWAFPQAS